MDARPKKPYSKRFIIQIVLLILGILALIQYIHPVFSFLKFLMGAFMPLIVGGAIAFVLNMPVDYLERKVFTEKRLKGRFLRFRRTFSILTTLIIFILIIFFISTLVVPQLIKSVEILVREIPSTLLKVSDYLNSLANTYPFLSVSADSLASSVVDMQKTLISYINQYLLPTISSAYSVTVGFFGNVVTFFIGLMFSLYVLSYKETLGRHVREIVFASCKEETAYKIFYVAHLTSKYFQLFISSQCIEAVILFCMYLVVSLIFRLPYAMMIAALICVFSLIPLFGAYIAWAISSFLLVIVNPMDVVYFTILFLIISQIESNFIYPQIVGSSMGIPGIWVLASVTVGGSLLGLLGMIIAVPVAAVLYTLLIVWKKQKLKEKNISWEMYSASPDWKKMEENNEN